MTTAALLATYRCAFLAAPSSRGVDARRRRRHRVTTRPIGATCRPLHVAAASSSPGPIRVTWTGTSLEVPGSGGVVGSGGAADAVVRGDDVDALHAKLEVRQGRIFLTALSKTKGTFLNGSKLFPGVAYALAEGAAVVLGEGDGAAEVEVEQVDPAGTAGVDMMAQMMQMQFEATMSPEVREALKQDDD